MKTWGSFFIANFSAGSKYWDEEDELKKGGIFLFDIDKELHKDSNKLQEDLKNFFDTLLIKDTKSKYWVNKSIDNGINFRFVNENHFSISLISL